MSVFKCGIKFKRVLGDSKQSAKNKLVAHEIIDQYYNILNYGDFLKAHAEMNKFASGKIGRTVQLYTLNEKSTRVYPNEDIFRQLDRARAEESRLKNITKQDRLDAFRKERLANEQITSVRDVIATQDSSQERFEDLSEIESTEEIPERRILTSSQKENISNLKQLDSRWEQYSDEDIQRFIESVFPQSQVKDIVYHGVVKGREAYDNILQKGFDFKSKRNWDTTKSSFKEDDNTGMFFSDYGTAQSYGLELTYKINEKGEYEDVGYDNIIPAILNIEYLDSSKETSSGTAAKFFKENKDKKNIGMFGLEGGSEGVHFNHVVFEPEQIYILNSDKAISDMEEFIRPKDIIDEEIQQKSKEIQELATKQVKAITEQEPKEGLNISDIMNNESSEEVKFDERTGQISLFPLLSIEEQWQTNQSKLLSKYPDITYEDFVSLTEQERENLIRCL